MNKRLLWLERYRKTLFMKLVDKYIADGDVILDVACGPGVNTILIGERYKNIRIYGVDVNAESLAFAKRSAIEAGLNNAFFIQHDTTNITKENIGEGRINMVVCTLGLSVIPDWEKALDSTIALLNPGDKYIRYGFTF